MWSLQKENGGQPLLSSYTFNKGKQTQLRAEKYVFLEPLLRLDTLSRPHTEPAGRPWSQESHEAGFWLLSTNGIMTDSPVCYLLSAKAETAENQSHAASDEQQTLPLYTFPGHTNITEGPNHNKTLWKCSSRDLQTVEFENVLWKLAAVLLEGEMETTELSATSKAIKTHAGERGVFGLLVAILMMEDMYEEH